MDIKITKHALQRFLERNENKGYNRKPKEVIERLFDESFPIVFSKEHMVKRLLNNGFENVDYFYNNGWIFVCSKDIQKIVITVERQEDKKFGRDIFRMSEK